MLSVISYKKSLEVRQDTGLLKQSLEWRTNLLLNVVIIVYGKIISQHLDWILSILVVFASFLSCNHHITDSVSNCNSDIFISFLHLLRKLDVSLLHFIGVFRFRSFLVLGALAIVLLFLFSALGKSFCDD